MFQWTLAGTCHHLTISVVTPTGPTPLKLCGSLNKWSAGYLRTYLPTYPWASKVIILNDWICEWLKHIQVCIIEKGNEKEEVKGKFKGLKTDATQTTPSAAGYLHLISAVWCRNSSNMHEGMCAGWLSPRGDGLCMGRLRMWCHTSYKQTLDLCKFELSYRHLWDASLWISFEIGDVASYLTLTISDGLCCS